MAKFAIDPDVPTGLLHDAVHRGQSEAGPFPDFFRGKEGLENTRLGGVIHAEAVVADGKHDVAPSSHRRMLTRKRFIKVENASLNGEFAALRHGVARVDRQVD